MIEASKTPRTDAELEAVKGDYRMNNSVSADFARQLERELNEAKATVENLKASTIHSCGDGCQRIECVLRRRVKELEKDKERLDWLDCHDSIFAGTALYVAEREPLRQAIDSAMQQGKETENRAKAGAYYEDN